MGKEVSRRDFLKLAGAALAGLGVAAVGLDKVGAQEEQEDRLEAFDIKEFEPIYQKAMLLEYTFGVRPAVFGDIVEVLDQVMGGIISDYGDERLARIRDGWGTRREQAAEEARNKALTIEMEAVDDECAIPSMRGLLYQAAERFPAIVLALPEPVRLIEDGGYASNETIATTCPAWMTDSRDERAAEVFIHEATHVLEGGGWKKVKEYLNRNDFINYVDTFYDSICRLIYAGVQNPANLENVYRHHWFTGSNMYGAGYDEDTQKVLNHNWIFRFRNIAERIGVGLFPFSNDDSGLTEEDITTGWLDYNLSLANYLLLLNNEQRQSFFDGNKDDLATLFSHGLGVELEREGVMHSVQMEGLYFGIGHYLVGPVKSENRQLEDDCRDIGPNQYDKEMQLKMQKARLRAFSTIPVAAQCEELPAMREALGLSREESEALDLFGFLRLGRNICCGSALLIIAFSNLVGRSMKKARAVNEEAPVPEVGDIETGKAGDVGDGLGGIVEEATIV